MPISILNTPNALASKNLHLDANIIHTNIYMYVHTLTGLCKLGALTHAYLNSYPSVNNTICRQDNECQ